MDFNGHKDLEEHFLNSLRIIDQAIEREKRNEQFNNRLHKLAAKITASNELEEKLLLQLQELSKGAKEDLNELYISLKEQHRELQNQHNQLKKSTIDLQESLKLEKDEITRDFQSQLQMLENKIIEHNFQLENTRIKHHDKLEAQQTSADLRFDNMQSSLRWQIDDTTTKLREANHCCNSLREELLISKSKSSLNLEGSSKQIYTLETELQVTKQQLHITREKLYDVTMKNQPDNYSNSNYTSHKQLNNNPGSPAISYNKPTTNIINNKIVMYNNEPSSLTNQNYDPYTYNKYIPFVQAVPSPSKKLPNKFKKAELAQPKLQCGNYAKYPLTESNLTSSSPELAKTDKSSDIGHLQNSVSSEITLKKKEFKKPPMPPLKQISSVKHHQTGILKKRKLYNPYNFDNLGDDQEDN